MDNLNLKNLLLSYQAVYDDTLCESMEELGLIGEARDVYQDLDELWQGRHGQTENQYQDSRSNAGKMISGTSTKSGATYSSRGVKNTGPNPAGGSQRPQGQGRMTRGDRIEMTYRKAALKNQSPNRGGGSSLSGVGNASGTGRFAPGSGGRYGLAGIGLADHYDLYDLILSHLLDEGYANTVESAEAIMVNMSEEWVGSIVEAEGSYGQTPKARAAYSNLARKRNEGGRTSGGDNAARHAKRTDPRPNPSELEDIWRRTNMTQADRDYNRGADEYGSIAYDPEEHDEPSGPGGIPKGKKLARQRKRGVSR